MSLGIVLDPGSVLLKSWPLAWLATMIQTMIDRKTAVLSMILARVVSQLENDPTSTTAWTGAQEAIDELLEGDAEVRAAVDAKDLPSLQTIVQEWRSGTRRLPEQDRSVFKRAMKAFKKRIKLTQLDADSSISGGPLSSGQRSQIVGMTAPHQYPREIWDELVHHGRLVDADYGMYGLPPSK